MISVVTFEHGSTAASRQACIRKDSRYENMFRSYERTILLLIRSHVSVILCANVCIISQSELLKKEVCSIKGEF
ncbi:hypothetical protein C7445_103229 [Alicyclobacillus sacchari]|uniref:Uncharacterized protein n=1 Tax=Alicyclobacillus sacchari TaxID=392010 RepID=A0A4R8LRF4_9BACL|nr:hypothetical protein C7445_103229 [Alicyclobacillus sacchari]